MNRETVFKFRLYVADHAQNSRTARANLDAMCQTHFAGQYEIEVIDVFKDPARGRSDGIVLTPTLVKIAPLPMRSVVGTLSQTQTVMDSLGLDILVA
jgi:circadian clock protein KaiB